tara:strand:+ start:12 stop:218 length:207 start_codon:yes stop_codon:yes gene_type:complete
MVVEEMDTDPTIHMVTTHLVNPIGVVDNHQVISKVIMLIDTNLTQRGVQVVTVQSMVTEVLEDVKVSL